MAESFSYIHFKILKFIHAKNSYKIVIVYNFPIAHNLLWNNTNILTFLYIYIFKKM
jgi:hypothetical protein